MNHTDSLYEKAVESLYRLQKFGIKFGLSKTSNLLKAVGNPHENQKYIHIAGTNGKGSVAAFLAAILRESGLTVGMYTSPHLVRFTERFKINNKEIPQETAVDLIRKLTEVFAVGEPPTFFEATTALALMYFAREKTDISIMEVGMGGRLDATNVITPMVSVITNISMEHKAYLGSRLVDIAAEKGGIIKNDVDLVTGVTQPSVIRLYESMTAERKARMWRVGKDTRYRISGSKLHFYGNIHRFTGLRPGLKGNFQARNAAVALTAIERLEEKGIGITSQAVYDGLEKTSWPGRMQIIQKNPMIMLDGAHNPAAAKVLAGALKKDFRYGRLILVIGIMEDKEIGSILKSIVPVADYVIFTRPAYSRAADPEKLIKRASSLNRPGHVIQDLNKALNEAKKMAGTDDLILVTGSLFTVGEAMSYLCPETCAHERT